MEFCDFHSTSMDQLPAYDSHESGAIDVHFWATMAAEVSSVADLETYRSLFCQRLAQVLLVLPHSNADPECLFSMVRKIETEERHQLGPSTICDLLSVKLNNGKPCNSNQHLMEDSLLKSAKLATIKVYRNKEYHSACQSHYHYKGLKLV